MDLQFLKEQLKEKGREVKYCFDPNNDDFSWEGNRMIVKLNYEDFSGNSDTAFKKVIKGFFLANDFSLENYGNELENIFSGNLDFKKSFLDKVENNFGKEDFWKKVELYSKKEKGLEYLTKDLIPLIKPLAEEYFGKKFIDYFVEGYGFNKFIRGSAAVQSGFQDGKYRVVLKLEENQFDEDNLSGEGIFNLLHEISHIHHYYLFGPKQNLDINLKEAYCELSAYEILRDSKNKELEKARLYAEKINEEESNWLDYPCEVFGVGRRFFKAYKYLSEEKNLKKREENITDTKRFRDYLKSGFPHKSRGKN